MSRRKLPQEVTTMMICEMNEWPLHVLILAGIGVVGFVVVVLLAFDLLLKEYRRKQQENTDHT